MGREFYETRDDFIKEAARLGCCRKVLGIPDGAELGSSRIFLAHRDEGPRRRAVVFGYFVLDGIVACTRLQEMIETVKESITRQKTYPVTALTAQERQGIPSRGCGEIDPPSYYFVGPDDVTVQLGYRNSVTASKTRLVLLPEIPIKFLNRFRGLMRADRLFEFAEDEGRTFSNMVERILRQYLEKLEED